MVQSGPREYVVAIYVLETADAAPPAETHFRARVERTGTRARRAMAELVAEVIEELRGRPGAEIVTDDAQANAVLARLR